MQRVTIAGPGRMGGALALSLSAAGYTIESIIGRDRGPSRSIAKRLKSAPTISDFRSSIPITSDIVFITASDPAIKEVAEALAPRLVKKAAVFHTSGSLSSNELDSIRRESAAVGSIHPLVSISTPNVDVNAFRGVYFCVEGDTRAVRLGKQITRRLGGRPFSIDPEMKPLYHLAAVAAAGHFVALADTAFSLMSRAGVSRREAQKILIPLIKSTVSNLEVQETATALTGTFARGDIAALERQIDVLSRKATDLERSVYLDLALRSIELAAGRVAPEILDRMRALIVMANQKGR